LFGGWLVAFGQTKQRMKGWLEILGITLMAIVP
jgi:hypothetical protein